MLWGTCDFLYVQDRPDTRLGPVLQKRGLEAGMAALLSYSNLSKQSLDRRRINYKIRPKWHLYQMNIDLFALSLCCGMDQEKINLSQCHGL